MVETPSWPEQIGPTEYKTNGSAKTPGRRVSTRGDGKHQNERWQARLREDENEPRAYLCWRQEEGDIADCV